MDTVVAGEGCEGNTERQFATPKHKYFNLRPVQNAEQDTSMPNQHGHKNPVIPLSFSLVPTDDAVSERDTACGDENPAQRLSIPKICGNMHDYTHENRLHTVYGHQSVDEAFGGR